MWLRAREEAEGLAPAQGMGMGLWTAMENEGPMASGQSRGIIILNPVSEWLCLWDSVCVQM